MCEAWVPSEFFAELTVFCTHRAALLVQLVQAHRTHSACRSVSLVPPKSMRPPGRTLPGMSAFSWMLSSWSIYMWFFEGKDQPNLLLTLAAFS